MESDFDTTTNIRLTIRVDVGGVRGGSDGIVFRLSNTYRISTARSSRGGFASNSMIFINRLWLTMGTRRWALRFLRFAVTRVGLEALPSCPRNVAMVAGAK